MTSNPNDSSDDADEQPIDQHGKAATRRGVLTGAAALGSTALLGSASGGIAQLTSSTAVQATEHQQASATGMQAAQDARNPDIDVLNYALTLEHLEYVFYRDGLEEFGEDELMEAKALDSFGETVRMEVLKYLAAIRDHEKAHVEIITKTVKDLDGEPVSEATYDFDYETPSEFLGVAQALENTGVAAYPGAGPTVSNDKVFI